MDELLDLGILKTRLSELIAHSNIDDCVLPNEFKTKFNAFGDYKIEHYNGKFSIEVQKSEGGSGLIIYT